MSWSEFARKMDAKDLSEPENDENVHEKVPKRVDKRKFRSQKRKKRRNFAGARKKARLFAEERSVSEPLGHSSATPPDPAAGPDENSQTLRKEEDHNVSLLKLMNSSFDSFIEGPVTRSKAVEIGTEIKGQGDVGNSLIDKTLLIQCLNKATTCKACKNIASKFTLKFNNKDGLAEHLSLVCDFCKTETPFETNTKLEGSSCSDSRGGKTGYDINRRSVLASFAIGHAGLEKFCGILNLPKPLNRLAYQRQLRSIEKLSVKVAEDIMKDAATKLIDITEKEDSTKMININGVRVAKVAITVDGTWQKRGFSSKNGAVFVISVRTGAVLDYEVLSMVCHQCRAHEHLDQESNDYKLWKEHHQNECPINHTGSSGSMETKGACSIFLRSIEERSLLYDVMVGDGDTGCYGAVCEAVEAEHGEVYKVSK